MTVAIAPIHSAWVAGIGSIERTGARDEHRGRGWGKAGHWRGTHRTRVAGVNAAA